MATVVKTAVTSCMSIDQSSSEAIDRWSCAIIPPKRALSPLREGICSQCAELGHADILLCDEAGSHLGVATPRPSRRALASAPQDEEGLRMPWMIYLILRSGHRPRLAVRDAALRRLLTMRGRTTPMQRPKMCACHVAFPHGPVAELGVEQHAHAFEVGRAICSQIER